jgi:hypothetical protein
MVGWMVENGLVARHAVPACQTFERLEARKRSPRRPHWLRLGLSSP